MNYSDAFNKLKRTGKELIGGSNTYLSEDDKKLKRESKKKLKRKDDKYSPGTQKVVDDIGTGLTPEEIRKLGAR